MRRIDIAIGVFALSLSLTAMAAQPSSQPCTVDVMSSEAGDSWVQIAEDLIGREGLQLGRTGQTDFAHAELEVFFQERCREKAIKVGEALEAKPQNVRLAGWKTQSDITVVFPRQEGSVEGAISKYGRFEIERKGYDCTLRFRRPTGKTTQLATIFDCWDGSVRREEQSFVGLGGEEFHIFAIEQTRGGNACSGTNYVVAGVSSKSAWASKEFGNQCSNEAKFALKERDGVALLEVVYPASSSGPARKFEVRKGQVTASDVKRDLRSQHQRTETGVLKLGLHGPSSITPDGGGEEIESHSLDCPNWQNDGRRVEMDLETRSYDDGTVQNVCLKLRVLDK